METSSGEESKQRKQEGQFPDAGVPNPNPANDPSLWPRGCAALAEEQTRSCS